MVTPRCCQLSHLSDFLNGVAMVLVSNSAVQLGRLLNIELNDMVLCELVVLVTYFNIKGRLRAALADRK